MISEFLEKKQSGISYRVCTKCGLEKALQMFAKDKGIKSGYRSVCRVCARTYQRNRRANERRDVVAG